MLAFALAVASALLFSFLCSVSEAVLLSVGHAQAQRLGEAKPGRLLRRFKREIDVPVAAILVLNTIAHTVGASVAGAKYPWPESTLWIFGLVFTLAVLLFTEIIPKTIGVTFNRTLAAPVTYFVYALTIAFKPVLFGTRALGRVLKRGHEAPVTSTEEIRLLAALGRTEGVLGQRFVDILEGAAKLQELTAKDVMMPRGGVAFLSAGRGMEENLETVRRTGHSRFPFVAGKNLDDVRGVVLTKDLLFQLHEGAVEPDWEALLIPAPAIPSTTSLERVLRTFQEERTHLGIVLDEYGGTQGIVTLEDVLEEIVGDITDESDRVDPFVTRRADGSLVCRGWAEMRKVLDLLEIQSSVGVTTVGGYVAQLAGKVPVAGDSFEKEGLRFTVLTASPRRALRVEVRRVGE